MKTLKQLLFWYATANVVFFSAAGWFMFSMPGRSCCAGPWVLEPAERELRLRLRGHVVQLAAAIGERNIAVPGSLAAAGDYLKSQWSKMGYVVHRQEYPVASTAVANLDVRLPGYEHDEGMVVVGAHYDSVAGSPGADDNASGIAVLLELSRAARERRYRRRLRFVAFANEESPFFQTRRMGSLVYANRLRGDGERLSSMVSLESLGFYDEREGSQRYPAGLGLLYPARGDFLTFVGNLSSRRLVTRSIKRFRATSRIPSEGIAAPGGVAGIGWSDHWSFWENGFASMMITDTAGFRNPAYHDAADIPDSLDYDRMALVVGPLLAVIEDLADAAR